MCGYFLNPWYLKVARIGYKNKRNLVFEIVFFESSNETEVLGPLRDLINNSVNRRTTGIKHRAITMAPTALEVTLALPTQSIVAVFLNGKPIVVEYAFDPSRKRNDCVLVDWRCLFPVIGGIVASEESNMISVSKIIDRMKKHLSTNVCSNHQQACPCHLVNDSDEEAYENFVKPEVDECEFGHSHHFCTDHVISWLYHYLYPMILLKESADLFEEEMVIQYKALSRGDGVYFLTGERPMSEFLLRNAEDLV